MENIVSNIIIISIVGSVLCSFLCAENGMKRYVGFALSVAIISALYSPIASFVDFFESIGESLRFDVSDMDNVSDTYLQNWLLSETDTELKEAICKIASSRFDISLDSSSIGIGYNADDYENVLITEVTIYLNDNIVIHNLNEFCDYISQLLMCECRVV